MAINIDRPAITGDKVVINADRPAITRDEIPTVEMDYDEERIYSFVCENEYITNSQACELLGLRSSRVREIFREMTEKNLLIAVGEKKTRRYIINQL